MTVYEFVNLCIDDGLEVVLYDLNTCLNIFKGSACDIPDEYSECEVCSFDPPTEENQITLNIDCEEI